MDGWPYFMKNLLSHMSAAYPWSQSHVLSSTWNKKLQINHIFQIHVWKINTIPVYKYYSQNSSLRITKATLMPKWKNEVSTKELLCKHKKMHCKANLISLPPCATLDPGKNSLFSFFNFSTEFEHIILNWGEPHNICSLLHVYWKKYWRKWMMMSTLGLVHP